MTTDDRLRVLHVVDGFRSDFYETLVRQTTEEVLHDVCVLLSAPDRSLQQLREAGARVDVVGAERVWSRAAWRAVRRHMREVEPAVIHGHMTHPTLLAALAGGSTARRRIVTSRYHGTPHRGARRLPHQALDRASMALSRRVVVSTLWLEGVVRGEGVGPERIERIPFAVGREVVEVDPSAVEDVRRRYRRSGPLVVVAGRLHPEKGQDVVIAALAEMRRRGRMAPTTVMVGSGPSEGELRTAIESSDLGDTVTLVGFQPELVPFLAAADLVVVPSRAETFGQVALEALALGVPVIGSDVDAVPEMFRTAGVHRLVAPGDHIALAGAIAAVLDDGDAVAAAAQARDRVRLAYSADNMGAAYLALYRKVAGEG